MNLKQKIIKKNYCNNMNVSEVSTSVVSMLDLFLWKIYFFTTLLDSLINDWDEQTKIIIKEDEDEIKI